MPSLVVEATRRCTPAQGSPREAAARRERVGRRRGAWHEGGREPPARRGMLQRDPPAVVRGASATPPGARCDWRTAGARL